MEWIDREKEFPDCDKILCYSKGDVFICELLETKWGNSYASTDWDHGEYGGGREWTHWMPLPNPPQVCL
jgi:Protein of unknown function (DUF551)